MRIKRDMRFIAGAYFVLLCGVPSSWGMPGAQHDALGRKLLCTAEATGGSKGMKETKVRTVNRWMDAPTGQLGQYRLPRLSGSPLVTPSNHQHIRHNPVATAKALSGTGKIDPAILNQARLHKIADVSATKAGGVDRWTITRPMRTEADTYLKHVHKHDALPPKMADWVDHSGPLLEPKHKAASSGLICLASKPTASPLARKMPKANKALAKVKVLGKTGKVAGPVGVVVELGICGKMAYDTETAFQAGDLSATERAEQHLKNGGQALGGAVGASSGAWAGASLGALTGPAAFICVPLFSYVGAVAGGLGGDQLGGHLTSLWISQKNSPSTTPLSERINTSNQ